jgi:hypothetical protein
MTAPKKGTQRWTHVAVGFTASFGGKNKNMLTQHCVANPIRAMLSPGPEE